MGQEDTCRVCKKSIYVLPEEERQDGRVWAHRSTGLLSCGAPHPAWAFALPTPPTERRKVMPSWARRK